MLPHWASKMLRAAAAPAVSLRRWLAAKTDRLNQAHWEDATGEPINQAIQQDKSKIRERVALEIARNPILEGVIETHVSDLIGTEGPTLQVNGESGDYNTALEAVWRDWWAEPDLNRQMDGVDFLDLWIRNLWQCGEFLAQIVTDSDREDGLALSLYDIHPDRLDTPMGLAGREDIVMGIRLTETGRPVVYHVLKVNRLGSYEFLGSDSDEIHARWIIHFFRRMESGQYRGVPWAAVSLQTMADLRDLDDETLDAIRQAADWSVALSTTHLDAPYIHVNESASVQRRTMWTTPPGWKAEGVQPTQPPAQLVQFRDEKLREVGRPVGMPLMIVKHDARQHNYSSARFDAQGYHRACQKMQGRLARRVLNRLVKLVEREAQLAGKLPARPTAVSFSWVWPQPSHVDPKKEAEAVTEKLSNLSATLSDAVAAEGRDIDAHMDRLRRDDQRLKATLGIGLIDFIKLLLRVKSQNEQQSPEAEEADGSQDESDADEQ